MQQAQVVAYLPQYDRHVLVFDELLSDTEQSRRERVHRVEMADLAGRRFDASEPANLGGRPFTLGALAQRFTLAPLRSHTAECLACTPRGDRSQMAAFCYAEYRVTGDSEQKNDPRCGHLARSAFLEVVGTTFRERGPKTLICFERAGPITSYAS